MHELHHLRVVVELSAQLGGIVVEHLVAVKLVARAVIAARPARGMAGGKVMIPRVVLGIAALVPQLHATLGEAVAVPVDHRAGLLAEQLHQLLIDVAGSVLGRHGDVIELVDLRAPRLLIAGVDGAQVVADAHAGREAVDSDDLRALLGGGGHDEHAAGAAADDQHLGLVLGDDLALVDFRLLAEPIAVRSIFLLLEYLDRDFALGLLDALVRRLGHSSGGDRRAGNRVDLRALRAHQPRLELLGRRLAIAGRLIGQVEHDIGDRRFAEGHRHGDGAHALRLRAVGARGVDALRTHERRHAGNANRRDGRSAGERALQKASAGKILHGESPPVYFFMWIQYKAGCGPQVKRTAQILHIS